MKGKIIVTGEDENLEKIQSEFEEVLHVKDVKEGMEVACVVFLDSGSFNVLEDIDQDVSPSKVASHNVESEMAAKRGIDSYVGGSDIVEAIRNAVSRYESRKDDREAKYKLEAVLRYTPASVYFKDTDLEYEEVSKYLLEEMGDSSPEDVKGKTDRQLHGGGLADRIMTDDWRVIEEGYVVDREMEYSPRDGSYDLTSKGPVVDEDGGIRGLYGIKMNVTEKRERMLIMESIQETSAKLLRSNKKNDIYAHGLESVFRLVDFCSAGYYVDIDDGVRFARGVKSFESEDVDKIGDVAEEALRSGEHIWDRKIGDRFVGFVQLGGHGCLAIVKDEEMNEYRREALSIMASNLEAALDRVEERQEKKKLRQLGDVISHELRNPLNIARGYLEEMEESREKEEVEEAMDRMENIINDLGELAKNKDAVEEVKRMEVRELAEEAWERIDTKDAELSIEGSRRFRGDKSKILEMFEGLFGNAVNHGGEDVEVEVGLTEEGFYVEDDGPGIPDEMEGSLFEYNFRPGEGNTGIGLSIIQKIVEGHGWSIEEAESEKGGARFEIYLS